MPRVRPLKEEQVPTEIRIHLQKDRSSFGTVLNSTGIYAHCPPILSAAKALGAAVEQSGRLPKQLRCLLNVRAAGLVGCSF